MGSLFLAKSGAPLQLLRDDKQQVPHTKTHLVSATENVKSLSLALLKVITETTSVG